MIKHKKPAKRTPAKPLSMPTLAAAVKTGRPGKPEICLSTSEIKKAKELLETTRKEILNRIQEKKALDMPENEVGDPIDQALQSLDKEILFEITDNDHLMMEQIEAALRRIEKGVYGMCESCRCAIPKKRLQTLPFARYCINCQTSSESSPVSIAVPE